MVALRRSKYFMMLKMNTKTTCSIRYRSKNMTVTSRPNIYSNNLKGTAGGIVSRAWCAKVVHKRKRVKGVAAKVEAKTSHTANTGRVG